MEKDELLARVAARPSVEDVYEQWFRRYHGRLVQQLRWVGVSSDDASDLAVDAITEVIVRLQRGDASPVSAQAYLYRIAVNAFIRQQASRRRERALGPVVPSDVLDDAVISPDDPIEIAEANEVVAICRRFLRPEDHKTIAMRMQGYGNEEIAQELGVSVTAVRTGLHRARRILREHLGYRPREARQQEGPALMPRDGREPLDVLGEELRRLRAESGGLTVREIAQRTGRRASYPTVHRAFQCHRVPRWAVVEAIVAVLGGDVDRFWHLWAEASGTPTAAAA